MCKSPLVSRCSLTWQLSFQWCKVCLLNTDLKVTRSYANYSYYITYCIFNGITPRKFSLCHSCDLKKSYQMYDHATKNWLLLSHPPHRPIRDGGNIVSATLSCNTHTVIGHMRRLFIVAQQFLATGGFQFLKVSFLQRYKKNRLEQNNYFELVWIIRLLALLDSDFHQ